MSDDVYEIYAIKYCERDGRSAGNFLGGDAHDVPMPLFYYVWAIVGAKRTIILDTGFDEATAARRQRGITRPVGEGLRALGID